MQKHFSLFLFLMTIAVFNVNAQTVDEIVQKHIDALGGRDKLKAVNSIKMTIKGRAQGFEFPVEMLSKKNGSMKTVTTIQNMKMIQAYDANGKTGWYINPMMGDKKPQKMNEDQVLQLQEQGGKMESDLLDYKEKGFTAEYLGKEDMDGEEVYLIRLTKKNGNITYYYIDVLSNLILKEKTKAKMKDKEFEAETYYSNYQTVDGITAAASIENMSGGVLAFQITVEKIEYNLQLDDKEFVMPDANANAAEQNKDK